MKKFRDKVTNEVITILINILLILIAAGIIAGIIIGIIGLVRPNNDNPETTTVVTDSTIASESVEPEISLNDGNEEVFG